MWSTRLTSANAAGPDQPGESLAEGCRKKSTWSPVLYWNLSPGMVVLVFNALPILALAEASMMPCSAISRSRCVCVPESSLQVVSLRQGIRSDPDSEEALALCHRQRCMANNRQHWSSRCLQTLLPQECDEKVFPVCLLQQFVSPSCEVDLVILVHVVL